MIKIRKKRVVSVGNHRSIGICGIESGAGVTHLCIALANYLCSAQRMRVAVVEMSGKDALLQMSGNTVPEVYEIKGVTYYPALETGDFLWVNNQGYDCLILDLGCEIQRIRNLLALCDQKLILGSTQPWKIQKYERCARVMKEYVAEQDDIKWLSMSVQERVKKAFQHKYQIQIESIPYLPEPFRIKQETFQFFSYLMGM